MFSKIKSWFCSESLFSKNLGLSVIRIGVGLIFIVLGAGKLMAGPEKWQDLGLMTQYVGISFWPSMWGLLGACAEFFGGIALLIGFATRAAALAIACVMIVATAWHHGNGHPFMQTAYPLSLLFVMIGLMIAGGGNFSVDRYIHRNKK
ncbi:MAG: DoxX family protein [Candidatus Babeliales bacterium]